ncbi:MAG: TIGR03619 family F420-dependent LLM class oxidoreductase [Ilumatobacteraceae bacterium]
MTTAELSLALINWTADVPDDWGYLVDRAVAAERAGFDRVVVSDHVVFGEDLDAYAKPELGGIAGGRQPTGPDGCWLEPLTARAVIAGATSRVRLATGVLLAALRRPAVLAKSAATLDVLSGGRLDLGVGIGWQREEYEAAGLDFEQRGRLLDHALEVCDELWRETTASYNSPELTFDGIHMMPKPTVPSGVPVWVSGTLNAAVLTRLARFGSGWIPWGGALGDIANAIVAMREGVAALGRDPMELGVVGSLTLVHDSNGALDAAATIQPGIAQVEAGVTDLRLFIPMSGPAAFDDETLAAVSDEFRRQLA